MAYSNLFKICLYLLWKKSYSNFSGTTLFLSHNTFFVADSIANLPRHPTSSSSLGKKVLLPALKIVKKTFQNLRYVLRVCKGLHFGLQTIHFPNLTRLLLQLQGNMLIFSLYSSFCAMFYSPPDEYNSPFYFLLSSLLCTFFFSVSFFSDFFFFTFSSPFFKLLPPNGPEL